MNEGPRVDAVRRRFGLTVQLLHDGHEGGQGVGYLNDGEPLSVAAGEFGNVRREGGGRDDGRSPAGLEEAEVAVVLDEGDVLRAGFGHWPGGPDDVPRVALDLAIH